jgi:hypothetical protein
MVGPLAEKDFFTQLNVVYVLLDLFLKTFNPSRSSFHDTLLH